MRKKYLAFLLILTILLSACGSREMTQGSEAAAGTDNEKMIWTLQEQELPDAEAALQESIAEDEKGMYALWDRHGETIYRITQIQDSRMACEGNCVQKLEAPYEKWENFPIYYTELLEDDICYMVGASIGENGHVYMLQKNFLSNRQFYLSEWSEEQGYTSRMISAGALTEELLKEMRSFFVCEDGTVYILTLGGIKILDSEFEEKEEPVLPRIVYQMRYPSATQKGIGFCGNGVSGGLQIWRQGEKEPLFATDELQMNVSDIAVWKENEEGALTEGFLCTIDGLWQLAPKEGKAENFLRFEEQGIYPKALCYADIDKTGGIIMLARTEEKYLLLHVSQETVMQNKTQLEFALTYADTFLKRAVVEFNKTNKEYQIVLRTPQQGENYGDFRTRIQAEVSGGGGPALLSKYAMDLKAAAGKGILRDLTEDFAEEREKMPENLRSVGEANGSYYAVPFRFSIQTLITSSELVGDREGWTMEEMLQCLKESGVQAAFCGYDSSIVFANIALSGGLGGKFIDRESRKSHFGSEQAVSLLETAADFGDDYGQDFGGQDRIAEGEVLCSCAYISGLNYVREAHGLLQGKEVYIGYPVEDGQSGNIVSGDMIAVNASCKDAEAAVEFIRFLLSEEKQEKIGREACGSNVSSGFPVLSHSLREMLDYAEEEQEKNPGMHQPVLDSTASVELYTLEPVEAEELEQLYAMLLSARPQETNMDGVTDIVLEEVPAYFTGGKTAQEVCDIVQNRVQLYLDEG